MSRKKVKTAIVLMAICALASACQKKPIEDKTHKKSTEESELSLALSAAAKDASSALKTLADVNNAAKLPQLTPNRVRQHLYQEHTTPPGLERIVTINKIMGTHEFIRFIRNMLPDYDVMLLGRVPVPDPLIDLRDIHSMSINYVLKHAGEQLDEVADIVIVPPTTNKKRGSVKVIFHVQSN